MLGLGGGAGTWEPGADSAVLLHLSADRARAAAVAVPRDLMVSAPRCRRPDGGASPAAYERFGLAFRDGGAACSIRAFEGLTGIRVDHHLVVDMAGLARIETAVGGGTDGTEGADSVDGEAGAGAGAGVVAGPGTGAGGRSGARHRDLLRTLANGSHGGSLAHPARFFGLLDTATSSITADPGLSSLPALYELAGSLRRVPADRLVFRTLPARPLQEAGAGRLLAALRSDGPVVPVGPVGHVGHVGPVLPTGPPVGLTGPDGPEQENPLTRANE